MHQSMEDQHEDLIFSGDEDESAPAFPNNTFEVSLKKGSYYRDSNHPSTSKKATTCALDTLLEIGLAIEQSHFNEFWNEIEANDTEVMSLPSMPNIDPVYSPKETQVADLLATVPQAIPNEIEPPPLMNEAASASPASSFSDFSDSSSMSSSSLSNDSNSMGDLFRNEVVEPHEGSIVPEDKDADPMQVDQATEVSLVSVSIELEPTEDLAEKDDQEGHIDQLRKKVAKNRKVLMRAVDACKGNGSILRAQKAYSEAREVLAAVMAVRKLQKKEVSIRKFYEKREMYKKRKGEEIPKPSRKSPRLHQ